MNTDNENCDNCCNGPVHGAIWPMASNGDDRYPYVEKCDDCYAYRCSSGFFDNDDDAAVAIANHVGEPVELAQVLHSTVWQPYVWHPDWSDVLPRNGWLIPHMSTHHATATITDRLEHEYLRRIHDLDHQIHMGIKLKHTHKENTQ